MSGFVTKLIFLLYFQMRQVSTPEVAGDHAFLWVRSAILKLLPRILGTKHPLGSDSLENEQKCQHPGTEPNFGV